LLLVGDAKQAIYRWRGGKAEQFIALGSDNDNPFSIKKEKQQLKTNYRSYSEIIDFNNKFFKHTSNFLENTVYKKMFIDGNNQSENKKKGGYVSLTFLEDEADKHDKDLRYPKQVLAKVLELRTQFSLGEICVLTRTKKDGIAIANYLSENAIPIVSSETLLLKNSAKVTFLIDVLKLIQNPEDEETKFEILYFLSEHLKLNSTKSQFLHQFAKKELFLLFDELQVFGIDFQISKLHQLPFYEKIESIIRSFNLINTSDAYVQFFLDVVLEQQRKGAELNKFLDFWDLKKEKLSIVAPESAEAVQIMTIHKSKGLEFPVVIFPCDVNIYNQINPKVWLDKLPENFNNFSELYVDFKKSISAVNERGLEIYNQQRQELELDNFNLLYVALTRAVEQLYVITEKKISSKGIVNTNYFSGVFIHYLQENNLWDNHKLNYNFGNKVRVSKKTESKSVSENHEQFISNPWQEHNIVLLASASKLWNTEQGKAIDFGNLIHDIFSKIYTVKDVEKVIQQFYEQGFLDDDQLAYIKNSIENVVHHPELKPYYSDKVTVFNERDIVDIDNQIIIPDRLVFQDLKTVTIIDYKTGSESQKHQQQIKNYARVLEQMNFKVAKRLLIYINDNIDIVEV
jgi:ATP-dependent exoDNAse (exonuclease V) beta subunit